MRYRVYEGNKPTEEFLASLKYANGYGCTSLSCDFCNRLHFALYNADAEFLAYAEAEYKDNSDGVVLSYEDDCVYGIDLGGILIVEGCLCNGLGRYESFIWSERSVIKDYIVKREEIVRINNEKDKMVDILSGTKGI